MCVYLFAPSRGQPLCFSLWINNSATLGKIKTFKWSLYLWPINASSAEGFSTASPWYPEDCPFLCNLYDYSSISHTLLLTRVGNNIGDCQFLYNPNNYSLISPALLLIVLLTSHITTPSYKPFPYKYISYYWFLKNGSNDFDENRGLGNFTAKKAICLSHLIFGSLLVTFN